MGVDHLRARSKETSSAICQGGRPRTSKDPATLKIIATAIFRAIEILAPKDHPMPFGQVPTSMGDSLCH